MAKTQRASNGRRQKKAQPDQERQQGTSSTALAQAQMGRAMTAGQPLSPGSDPRGPGWKVATPDQQKQSAKAREQARKGTPRPKQEQPKLEHVSAALDHGSLNHTREAQEGNVQFARPDDSIGPLRTEARGSTPWPQNIADMDEQTAAEAIRTTDKADVLYKWRNDERNSEAPRQSIVDLIYAKLLQVQGPPLPLD